MNNRFIRFFWGDLTPEESKKFSLLALGFFFIIASWWPIKTVKDTIFLSMVGVDFQPWAKSVSVIFFFPLVLLYSKLVDLFSKNHLIYLFVTFYGVLGLIFVYFLQHPTIGVMNQTTDPWRLLGWFFYLFAESYISLILALYWSYTNDVTTPESAQKGYGLIIFGNQLGGFLSTLLGNYVSRDETLFVHRAPYIVLASVSLFFFVGIVVYFIEYHSERSVWSSDNTPEPDAPQEFAIGFIDGLTAIITRPYVAGIFGILFFQEAISSILNFQMIRLACAQFTSSGQINKFLFDTAFAVQIIAAIFALFGTSFFQRRFGITFCLIAYPTLLGILTLIYMSNATLPVIFYSVLVAKALSYALNQPTKEVLYIPTSRSIKYKSKAWIDMFGLRFAKASASWVNGSIGHIVPYISISALGMIGLWIGVATTIGAAFKKAIKENHLVE